MTTIHNLGIVIQQGGVAAEAQQIKHHPSYQSNIAASLQPAREVREQSTVQETTGAEKTALRDKGEENKGTFTGQQSESRDEKTDKPAEDIEKSPDSAGYIIDTIA